MTDAPTLRQVVVLAPMPLEFEAVAEVFGLQPNGGELGAAWSGIVGGSAVSAVHIGMGPPLTRVAVARLFSEVDAGHRQIDHLMMVGICGGLRPNLPVGTLVNPEVVEDHATGARFLHRPPGEAPRGGTLVTTDGVSLDLALAQRMADGGGVGVDMESATMAALCEERGCSWSVYRCISDRAVDGLLDERIVALTEPDGSVRVDELVALLAEAPELGDTLGQLANDSALAARLAAEAALRACHALDT